jgi:hypothetical protein
LIILITVKECDYTIYPGDTFSLTINDDIIVSETFTEKRVINYVATFVFAKENGSVLSSNACGIFGNKNDLPEEIKNAVYWEDLPIDKRNNFISSAGFSIILS